MCVQCYSLINFYQLECRKVGVLRVTGIIGLSIRMYCHLDLRLWRRNMFNLTADNYTEPMLPENPLTYFVEYNYKLLLWMTPLLVLTIWVNIYILFNIMLYFAKLYNDCVDKKNKTVCVGEFKCKKGCENCVGKIFLETYT